MNSERSRQLGFAVEIAREAGTVMKSHFMKDMKREFKTDHTIVTEVDKKINSMVIDAVRRAYPEHNILAEEYSPKAKNSRYTWVCDPIDGSPILDSSFSLLHDRCTKCTLPECFAVVSSRSFMNWSSFPFMYTDVIMSPLIFSSAAASISPILYLSSNSQNFAFFLSSIDSMKSIAR